MFSLVGRTDTEGEFNNTYYVIMVGVGYIRQKSEQPVYKFDVLGAGKCAKIWVVVARLINAVENEGELLWCNWEATVF